MSIDIEEREGSTTSISGFENVYELDLEALIDGELTAARQDAVLTAIQKSPELQKKYAQLCQQKSMLKLWWKTTSQNT